MIWNAKVLISKQIYNNFTPLIYIFRIFGIFPITTKTSNLGVCLNWSIWLALYSYSFGFIIITATIFAVITETFQRETATLDGASFMDKLVTVFPFAGYCISTFFGVFIMASKTSHIFTYFNCIKDADKIIKTSYNKIEKYKSLLVPLIVFINSEIIHCINIYLFKTFIGDTGDVIKKIITRHAPFLLNIYVSLMIEYLNRLMTYNLELRFNRLNEVLKTHYHKMKVYEAKFRVGLETAQLPENVPTTHEVATMPSNLNNERTDLLKLNQVYLRLIEAANMINDLFGLNILVVITATFFDFISTSYFLILVLQDLQESNLELIIQLCIFSFNMLRVLIITEPMYRCMGRIGDVAAQVCKLLSLNVGQHYRQQVHTFAECIYLSPLEFSACEYFTVDRLLISTFIGGVTNYVVILLGMKQET